MTRILRYHYADSHRMEECNRMSTSYYKNSATLLNPGTHGRQSQQLPNVATKSTVNFVADLSPILSTCRQFVESELLPARLTLSTVSR